MIASDQGKAKEATEAANHWITLVDGGDYGAIWDQAAQMFMREVTREQWTKQLESVRAPLGRMASRKMKTAVYTTTLPGAPSGEYVVVQYDSGFEHKKAAVETVTFVRENGSWRAAGYYIR